MTIKKLISDLKKYPENLNVFANDTKTSLFSEIIKIEKKKGINCVYLLIKTN